jgi:hypothetical protein
MPNIVLDCLNFHILLSSAITEITIFKYSLQKKDVMISHSSPDTVKLKSVTYVK